MNAEETNRLKSRAVEVLKTVYDPEIPVSIYELGLVYGLEVRADGHVDVRMTLTTPACPVAGSLPGQVENKLRGIPGVSGASVELVWDPPWSKERMSAAARLALGLEMEDEPQPRKPFFSKDALRRRP